jgi:HCOMODA/2-hydroxy-3-carboxy-muconic semialdehyde decarboxylase
MRRHGITVAGRSVREVVFRSIYGARNAEVLGRAMALGEVTPLTAGERELAGESNLKPLALDRAWELWARRIGPLT